MHNNLTKEKNFIQRNKWFIFFILIIASFFLYFVYGNKKPQIIEGIDVIRRDVVEVVATTGTVKPISDLNLSFETGGQIANVYITVGDKVIQGQRLASLSNADLAAAVNQAKAGLKIAEANLTSLRNGSTPEQIAVNQSQVDKAKIDLFNAQTNLINSVKDAYTKSDDAIRNYTDIMFSNPRSQSPKLEFQTDAQLENDLLSERVQIEQMLLDLNIITKNLTANSDLNSAVNTADNTLSFIQTFLQNLAFAVNKLSTNSSITQSTLSLWKTNISSSRASIDVSLNNLSQYVNQYQSSLYSLNIYNSQLNLIKSGATIDQIKAQEATVEQAKANLDAAEARFNKSIIFSPISGVVTNVNTKIGQTIQAGNPAVSVISYGEYEIESYIPEADIAKIKLGNTATTTLDAYGPDIFFETLVTKIDPGETVIDNVPTYKITLKFASLDIRIKPGMTANLDIRTKEKSNVLVVPSRSVYTIDNKKYVKLIDSIDSSKFSETVVQTGIRGVDGFVEVISGLKEGDRISASYSI